jgi:hypothetical protein
MGVRRQYNERRSSVVIHALVARLGGRISPNRFGGCSVDDSLQRSAHVWPTGAWGVYSVTCMASIKDDDKIAKGICVAIWPSALVQRGG